jgi:hypothetical protein
MRRIGLGLVLAVVTAAPAPAAASPESRLYVARAVDASCSDRGHDGAGTARLSFRAGAGGYLTARLDAARSDWDLAVFRPGRREPVAASAYRGAHEVASGFVRRGARLTLRACRRSGTARSARIRVDIERLPAEARERVELVRVRTPSLASRRRLERLSLDITEHGGPGFVTAVLHGRDDGRRLRDAGFSFHPSYGVVVDHYEGTSVPGGGNREAYYVAMESAANPAHHAVLRGSAPAGAILRLRKSFQNRVTVGSPTSELFDTTMEVPPSGRLEWHVNQSGRPLAPGETWTLTCERPEGAPQLTQLVPIGRGQARELDLSACGPAAPPPPAIDTRTRPGVAVRLAATFDGRRYRVRVSGRLRNVTDFERCDGVVRLTLAAGRKRVAVRRAGLDEACRFARRITFRPRALPRGLRGRGARLRLRAVASWPGNEFLQPAEARTTKRVRRRP